MLLMAMAIIFMDACKGEKGDVGPSGTAGVAGPTGANGATGVAGPTGTANVVYGTWQDMNNTNFWYKLGTANTGGDNNGGGTYNTFQGRGWGCDINAPITQDILDKGQVFVYAKWQNGYSDKRVFQLPIAFWGNWAQQTNILLNKIYIQTIYDANAQTVPSTYNPTGFLNQFRYIIIPGGVAGGRKANVDYSDYEAVKKAYNIPD
jgi:hypothetical protein